MRRVTFTQVLYGILSLLLLIILLCAIAWFGFPEGSGKHIVIHNYSLTASAEDSLTDITSSDSAPSDTSADTTETAPPVLYVDPADAQPDIPASDSTVLSTADTTFADATTSLDTATTSDETPTTDSTPVAQVDSANGSDTASEDSVSAPPEASSEATSTEPLLSVSIEDGSTIVSDTVNVIRDIINAVLGTDKGDYSPTDSAIIAGSGLDANTAYTLTVSSEDDPPTSTDAEVTTDADGNFTYTYQLDGNYRPNYQAVLKDFAGVTVISITFTDSLTLTSATLDGGASTVVLPSATITAVVSETNTAGSKWHSIGWRISTSPTTGGTSGCYNNADHNTDGTFSESFSITAPDAEATYNAYFAAYTDNACSTGASPTLMVTSGVVVSNKPNLTVVKANDAGDSVNTNGVFHWVVTITNIGNNTATFTKDQIILQDNLPNTNATYSTPTDVEAGSASTNISCTIAMSNLTCKSSNTSSVTIPKGGSITITVPVTAGASAGTLVNPRSGAGNKCQVDPSAVITESDETNNLCSDTVTVVMRPDLTVVKANDVSGTVEVNKPYNWTLTITNTGGTSATFTTGQTILTDNLPSSNATYGTVATSTADGTTGKVSCSITSNNLSCTASGGSLVIPTNGTVTVTVPVTAGGSTGTLTNPRSGAGNKCAVDPNGVITEDSESNNSCSDSVSVAARPDLSVVKTNNLGGNDASVNSSFNWILTITNIGDATATFSSSQTILTDNLPSSGATYGTPTDAEAGSTSTNVSCSISTGNLTCKSSNTSSVTIPVGGSITIMVSVTPTTGGSLVNPRSGGSNTCKVDPNSVLIESNNTNNNCADTVTVNTRTTTSATLNGGSSVSVAPEASVTTVVTGTLSGDDWHATEWSISNIPPGVMACVDTADANSDGTVTKTITITAPSTPGTYNAYFRINGDNKCASGSQGTLLAMANAVVVVPDTSPPSAPGIPTGTTPDNDSTPKISWTAANDDVGIDHYILYWDTVAGSESNNSGTIDGSKKDFTVPLAAALTEGTWYFKIKAYDAAGNSAASNNGSILVDLTPPTDPDADEVVSTTDNVDGVSDSNTITMMWPLAETLDGAHDALSGVAGYSYKFSQNATDEPDQKVDLPADATTVTSGALADGGWYFHLSTVDKAGNWTHTRHEGKFTKSHGVAGIPFMKDATITGTDTITVNWQDKSTNEDNFRVERKLKSEPDSAFVEIGTVVSTSKPGTGTLYSYSDTALSCNTQYTYRVRSYNAGTGLYSSYSTKRDAQTLYLSTDSVSSMPHDYSLSGMEHVPILSFTLTSCRTDSVIKAITPTYTGTDVHDISKLKVYVESDGSGFSAADDHLLGSANAGSKADINIDFPSDYSLGAHTKTFYLVADMAPSVPAGHTLKAKIKADKIDSHPHNPAGASTHEWPLKEAEADWNPYVDSTPPVTSVTGIYHFGANPKVTVTFTCSDVSGSGCYKMYYTNDNSTPTSLSSSFNWLVSGIKNLILPNDSPYVVKFYSTDVNGNNEEIQSAAIATPASNIHDFVHNYFTITGLDDSASQVEANNDLLVQVPVGDTNSLILLPAHTVIERKGGGTLDVNTLKRETPVAGSLSGLGTGQVVEGAVQWGIPGSTLIFSTSITISIFVGTDLNGQTLNVFRSPNADSGWTSDGIVAPATCTVDAGYCTFQATEASYYTAVSTAASSGSTPSIGSNGASLSGPYSIGYIAQLKSTVTNPAACSANTFPTKPIRIGAKNDPAQVKLLEQYLNTYEHAKLPVDGVYSKQDVQAVIAWQEKYASEILTPWGETKGTGYVFTTSLKKFKDLFLAQCQTGTITTPNPTSSSVAFYRDLQSGMSGNDVLLLQNFLIAQNIGPAAVALAKAGTSTYFGNLTKAALIEYQQAKKIVPVSGYFGPKTRKIIEP
jgi:hypothetical protein